MMSQSNGHSSTLVALGLNDSTSYFFLLPTPTATAHRHRHRPCHNRQYRHRLRLWTEPSAPPVNHAGRGKRGAIVLPPSLGGQCLRRASTCHSSGHCHTRGRRQ